MSKRTKSIRQWSYKIIIFGGSFALGCLVVWLYQQRQSRLREEVKNLIALLQDKGQEIAALRAEARKRDENIKRLEAAARERAENQALLEQLKQARAHIHELEESVPQAESPPDDLTAINGVGPVYAERLRERGLHTFAQLAGTTPEQIRTVLNVPGWRKIEPEAWIEQAKELAID